VLQEIKSTSHFLFDLKQKKSIFAVVSAIGVAHLFHGAEDVSIILLESPHSGEPRQGTGELISVQDTKVGKSQRHFSPRSRAVVEHQTKIRALLRLLFIQI
jgi:hypothetical protein